MLQIGRYSYRGTGAVMVAGPLGVALVPPEWAKGAREALIGRAEIVAWLTQVSQAGADAAVLDLAGPQADLSLLGRAWVRALAPGLAEAQEWQAPVWGWALNPGDWECLDVELGVAEAERTVGEWRLATEDLVDARSLRIGRALREETDRFERPFELPQAGASSEALGASRLAEYRDGESGALGGLRRAARIRAGESPGGPGAQGIENLVAVVHYGQHHHVDFGIFILHQSGGVNAGEIRHINIHQHDIGPLRFAVFEYRAAIGIGARKS